MTLLHSCFTGQHSAVNCDRKYVGEHTGPLSACEQLKIYNVPSVRLTAQETLNLIYDTLK